MFAKIAAVGLNTGSKLLTLLTRAKTTVARMKSSEVAEALIATWCIEFLRMRKIGGFNVVEIIVVSALMLGVKTIITEAGRRNSGDTRRSFVMSDELSSMDKVDNYGQNPFHARRWSKPIRRPRYKPRFHRSPR